jgi:hypothetical protein
MNEGNANDDGGDAVIGMRVWLAADLLATLTAARVHILGHHLPGHQCRGADPALVDNLHYHAGLLTVTLKDRTR